jgi:hypothetical protein
MSPEDWHHAVWYVINVLEEQSRGGLGGPDMWHELGRRGTCIGYW